MAVFNPQAVENQNINISAYRVLSILLVLVQYRSLNMVELNRFLFENPLIQRVYNTETLTKYINTLRGVGCDIPRSSSRTDFCYELRRHPFPLQLEPEEIQVAEKLLLALSQSSDEALYKEFRDFLDWLTWSLQSVHQTKVSRKRVVALFPELEARRKKLSTYRQYCQDAFTLQIRYRHKGNICHTSMEAHDVLDRGKNLLLLGTDTQSHEQMIIDIDHIESIHQLPSKNKRQMAVTTVVFALFDRLAKSYRLYPEEKIIYQNNHELHIKAKVNDPSLLLNRLMKYGASCEVISPTNLRHNMQERIQSLLSHLS